MPLGAPITQAITNGLGLAVEIVSARRQKSKQPAVVLTETTLGSSLVSAKETDPPVQQEKDITEPLDHGEVEYLPAISELDIKDEEKYHDAQESPTEDEQNWALDDAANALEQPVSEESRQLSENSTISIKYGVDGQPTLDSLVAIVLSKCPPITYSPPRLERPVIIPQRRPGAAGRGFIRAYAPVLAESGIPQETFISFLKTFHRASQASPVLGVIYISAGIVGLVPYTATLVTSIVVQVAVGAAIELQKRQRSNSFLDEMNEKIFRPRGKYALIMTYKPDATKAVQGKETDISEMVYKRSTKDGFKFAKGKFKRESGTTYAEVNMPESAPLVFPGLEQQSTELGQIQKVSSGKQSQKFLADYYDRRAQAIYMKNHPESNLALPADQKPQFASWLSDPNDPRNNGSMITLLTGGKVNLVEKRKAWEAKRAAQNNAIVTPEGRIEGPAEIKSSNWEKRRVKRVMKRGVLYLMIVNMPTEEEMAAAREAIQQSGRSESVKE